MAFKIYDNAIIKGTLTAEAPASTGAYRVLVFNTTTKRFESVDPSEIGGGGGGGGNLGPGCYAACGIIQGKNFTQESSFENGYKYWLRYRVGDSSDEDVKSENIVEAQSQEIQYPFFAGVQPDYLSLTAELVINNQFINDVSIPDIPNYAVALVVAVNGLIVFAKTIQPDQIMAYLGTNPTGPWAISFEDTNGDNILGPAWGYVSVVMSPLNSDTNSVDQGILAMGQHATLEAAGTQFTSQVEMIGGGMSSSALSLSTSEQVNPTAPLEAGFSWSQWGDTATNGFLTVIGQNNESFTLYVQIVSSFDETLNSYEAVIPGASYNKSVPLNQQQLQDNDFYVNITNTPPEP